MTAQPFAVMREFAPQRSRERLRLSVKRAPVQGHSNNCPTQSATRETSFNPSASGAVIQISVPTDTLGKTNMPRLTLLSSLVLAAAAVVHVPAFAAPSDDANVVQLSTRQTLTGDAVFSGQSAAVATLGADALRDAHGNFGVNAAAGALNAQSNQIVLAKAAHILVDTQQTIRNAAAVTGAITGAMHASLGDRALMGASGNIGVNVVAGAANAQANALAIH